MPGAATLPTPRLAGVTELPPGYEDLQHHAERVDDAGDDGVRVFRWRGGQRAQRSTLPVATLRRLAIARGIPPAGSGEVGEWSDEHAERVVMVPFTDGSIDSYRTIIDPDGLDLTRFESNPVSFFSHASREIPIGIVLRIDKAMMRGEDGVMRAGLVAHLLFSPEELEPEAERIYRNWIGGRLRGSSIGFLMQRGGWRSAEAGDIKKFKLPADTDLGDLLIFHKTSLSEISIVPIPANVSTTSRSAELRHIASSGAITRDDAVHLFGEDAVGATEAEDWADVRAQIGADVLLTGDDEPENIAARLAELERRVDAMTENGNHGAELSDPGAERAESVSDFYEKALGIEASARASALVRKLRRKAAGD